MPPEGADRVLASHIPHRERDIFVLDSLDIESCEALELLKRIWQQTGNEPIVGIVVTTSPSFTL
jgi:hypothetical protein